MNLILYAVKQFHGIIKISVIVIFAQIWYHEAQSMRGIYPLHGFVWPLPEPQICTSIRKAATRSRKSPMGIIYTPTNEIFHENHKYWILPSISRLCRDKNIPNIWGETQNYLYRCTSIQRLLPVYICTYVQMISFLFYCSVGLAITWIPK